MTPEQKLEAIKAIANNVEPAYENRARVILFKSSGKYYTEEYWTIPEDAIGPYDMIHSVSFRRIGNGAVLVDTQEPWGYPHLFPSERSYNG